ncbi:MAG: hypothetical protein GY697_13545 [Desulfobacterales bacterium]|nr:hypothetical protein [Desulfobacterales bacterium]
MADRQPIREKSKLEEKVKKACRTISLGLEHLLADADGINSARAGSLISRYRLAEIFRVGYGLCLNLKWQAHKWQRAAWANRSGLPLHFWGETWLGVLGGLLLDHPRFYDESASSALYRDFESLADIDATRSVLDAVAAFDNLLSKMQITLKPLETYGYVGHYNLVLTLWARRVLAVSETIDPLSIEQVRQFFSHLWGQQEKPYRVSNEKKEQFLAWISETAGLPEYEVSESLGQTFETVFRTLEEEYANVLPQTLELKYVQGFFLLAPEAG